MESVGGLAGTNERSAMWLCAAPDPENVGVSSTESPENNIVTYSQLSLLSLRGR